MLPKNFYDRVEDPNVLKHILYGDSVSKDMKTIVKFKNSNIVEYISFENLWNRLSNLKSHIIENEKEYIFIDGEIETVGYDIKKDTWLSSIPKYIMRHKIDEPIIRLNFTNLAHIDVTKNHSMLDYNPTTRDLKIKNPTDLIYIPTILTDFSIKEENIDAEYLLLGLWFGDGNLPKGNSKQKFQYPAISSNNQSAITEYLKSHLKNVKIYKKNEWDFCINYPWLRDLLISLKLDGVKSIHRIIPNTIFVELSKDYNKLISFFIGYWIADGSFNTGQTVIASANKYLLEQIQTLLMIIGIYSHLKLDKNNRKYNGQINGDMYKLSTSLNQNLFKLLQQFEFLKDSSQIMEFKSLYYGSCSGGRNRQGSDYQVCRKSKYAQIFKIKPVKIISKDEIKYNDYVYDLCIPETQNFIANGCLVHNTDSLFITIPAKNCDKISTEEKIKISDKVSEDINTAITKYLNEYLLPKSNISIDQNSTYFKSEMLMEAIMFLDVKKNYAYKILAKKGKIFAKPKIDYTGIQVVKSDAAKLTQELLKDMVENVILNPDIDIKSKMPKIYDIVSKSHQKFLENVKNLEINDIAFPGKWSKKVMFINGMMMYNFIMKKDIFSMGSAGNFIYCTFRNPKLFQSTNLDMTKVNGICVPYVYDKLLLEKKLKEFQIEIDKTIQWEKLFTTTCQRITELARSLK